MTFALELVSWFCLLAGGFFCVVGAVGMHRFPDFYARTHASGITDTLGAGLVLLGLMCQEAILPEPNWYNIPRLIFILLFIYITSPTSTHALAKAAYTKGPKPILAKNAILGKKEKSH